MEHKGAVVSCIADSVREKVRTLLTCVNLTLNLLTTTIVAPPSNASKWQMGFNSAFKGLKYTTTLLLLYYVIR